MATWTTGFVAYLQPGVSVTLAFTWPTGKDPGVQAIIARPRGPQSWQPPKSTLLYEVTTESYGVAARLKGPSYSPSPPPSPWYGGYGFGTPKPLYQPEWTYFATFRNTGQLAAWCELIGGEVV